MVGAPQRIGQSRLTRRAKHLHDAIVGV